MLFIVSARLFKSRFLIKSAFQTSYPIINLESEYTEDLREIESKDRANLCEDGPDESEQQQECTYLDTLCL